jgi:hypothetical protein
MSAVKTVAWGVLVWTALGAVARADSLSSNGSWVYFTWGGNIWNVQTEYPSNFNASSPSSTPTSSAQPVLSNPSPQVSAQANTASSSSTSIPAFSTPAASSSPSSSTADAFLNFGTVPYPELSTLTVGNAQPWYDSPSVTKFFNGSAPSTSQQAAFTQQVLQDIQQTFSLAGMHPNLTLDPTVPANHTLSVVSGISYGPNPNAIGITDVGQNGFGFIDKFSYASNLTDLEWAVAHNISHELMHAFGVGYHPDQTGTYIDAGTATWALLTNPSTTFSPGAYTAITATNYGAYPNASGTTGAQKIDGDQEILAAPVPEPSTVAIWSLVLGAAALCRRSRVRARRRALA